MKEKTDYLATSGIVVHILFALYNMDESFMLQLMRSCYIKAMKNFISLDILFFNHKYYSWKLTRVLHWQIKPITYSGLHIFKWIETCSCVQPTKSLENILLSQYIFQAKKTYSCVAKCDRYVLVLEFQLIFSGIFTANFCFLS